MMDASLINRIEARLRILGMTERAASGTADTIRNIRRRTIPGIDKCVALARVLGTTVQWLVTGEEDNGQSPSPITETERGLIEMFRTLTPEQQAMFRRLLIPVDQSEIKKKKRAGRSKGGTNA